MTKLAAKLQMMRHSDKGATMVEYGLMVVVVALVVMVGAALMGDGLNDLFARIATRLGLATPAAPAP